MFPLTAVLLLAAVFLAAAGCGGDGDSGSSGDTTATAAAENTRLTPEQWSAYRSSAGSFRDAREAAQKKLDSCPQPDTGNLDAYGTCIGGTLDGLTAAATALGEVLTGFIGTVSGSCATALNDFTQYVTPFVASVEQLQQTLSDNNAAALANSKSSVQTALTGGMQERETFERECAPL